MELFNFLFLNAEVFSRKSNSFLHLRKSLERKTSAATKRKAGLFNGFYPDYSIVLLYILFIKGKENIYLENVREIYHFMADFGRFGSLNMMSTYKNTVNL